MNAGLWFPLMILLGVTALLRHQATALEPQWGLAHCHLCRVVRGVFRGQAPLRVVKIFLRRLPVEEEG
jgi:hypothetical protein